MENRLRLILISLAIVAAPALAAQMLTDKDLAYVFVGREMTGHYANGATFTETYHRDGTITYADGQTKAKGKWTITGPQFCTAYDAAPGGCFNVVRQSENCFEYWLLGTDQKSGSWLARASQSKYPSTCPSP